MEIENNNSKDENWLFGGSRWWEIDGPVPADHDNSGINRHWFPQDFIFGTGTSAFQVEGAAAKGGRGISIWDDFSMRLPWKIVDGTNGSVACDMYNRYKEDIKMMKQIGFDAYRFSISWPRILPGGRCSGGINREGIDYYNDVINTVLHHGMKPFVTLFHWDLPLCLEKEYGGFLSKRVKDDFREFAEVCFWEFGDRVKHWTTLNEPWTYAVNGYVRGTFPPGRKVHKVGTNTSGDRSEAYKVGRNLVLAHADAVDVYRSKFQEAQGGMIGIVLNSRWFTSFDEDAEADAHAVARAFDFMLGWFLEPLLYGRYPESMRSCEDLAFFSDHEREKIKDSVDFLGLNYYTAQYAADDPRPSDCGEGYLADQRVKFKVERDGIPIGTPSGSVWLHSVPKGIYHILIYLNDKYPELKEIYITENGFSSKSDCKKTAKMVCDDDQDRSRYHQDHLANMLKAIKHKDISNKVKGYFMWSWCDNFEWSDGYTARFGLVYVDYVNGLTRYPKNSAAWFARFLKSKEQPPAWFRPWWVPPPLFENSSHQNKGETETDKKAQTCGK